uniref:Sporulation domain protein n=1 Tax=Solibacter usitatus (strain Ellin6076) TaxID=234267 RepID=Q028R0_SOLUE
MRNNDTGEFELVVGNKQLLSGFFIVVLLFAVAFAMGYVVGQNSPRSAKMASEGGATSAPVTSAADARPQPYAPPPAPAPAPAPTGEQAPESTPQPSTQPAQGSQPAAASPATKAAEEPASPGIVASADLPAGNYWQVLAVKPEVSDAMRQTLKDKGFQVVLTPGINNLTRVLVGPFGDTNAMGRAKTELENAGFRPVRYKP